jgi:hypothetical protein
MKRDRAKFSGIRGFALGIVMIGLAGAWAQDPAAQEASSEPSLETLLVTFEKLRTTTEGPTHARNVIAKVKEYQENIEHMGGIEDQWKAGLDMVAGVAHEYLDHTREAEAAYLRASQLYAPGYRWEPAMCLGGIYIGQKRWDEAIMWFKFAQSDAPDPQSGEIQKIINYLADREAGDGFRETLSIILNRLPKNSATESIGYGAPKVVIENRADTYSIEVDLTLVFVYVGQPDNFGKTGDTLTNSLSAAIDFFGKQGVYLSLRSSFIDASAARSGGDPSESADISRADMMTAARWLRENGHYSDADRIDSNDIAKERLFDNLLIKNKLNNYLIVATDHGQGAWKEELGTHSLASVTYWPILGRSSGEYFTELDRNWVVAHELGHLLGLDHVSCPGHLMYSPEAVTPELGTNIHMFETLDENFISARDVDRIYGLRMRSLANALSDDES